VRQELLLELMPICIREARLLGKRKLKEWLELFTDDVLNFIAPRKNVPCRGSHRESTPLGDLANLEEDRTQSCTSRRLWLTLNYKKLALTQTSVRRDISMVSCEPDSVVIRRGRRQAETVLPR
jgi:hypothetical protein